MACRKRKTEYHDHVMIDLETLGTSPGCVILSIGAAHFTQCEVVTAESWEIDLESSLSSDFAISGDTLRWWLKQRPEILQQAISGTMPVSAALDRFCEWHAKIPSRPLMWANGPTFDLSILRAAYDRIGNRGGQCPWSYWEERCFRTVRDTRPDVWYTGPANAHSAIADAIAQAQHVIRCWQAPPAAKTEEAA